MNGLLSENITRVGRPGYEYGRTREEERGLLGSLTNIFTPFRRPVTQPEITTYEPMMDAPAGSYIPSSYQPAQYGDPEFGLQYMPAYRALTGAVDYFGNLISSPEERQKAVQSAASLPGIANRMLVEQQTAGLNMLGGYGTITPEGQPIEYDPLMFTGSTAVAPVAATRAAKAGEMVLGSGPAGSGRGVPPKPTMTEEEMIRALEEARQTQYGRMVGRYQTPEAGAAYGLLSQDIRQLAEEGAPGRLWYERSSDAILNVAGGDKNRAEQIAQLIAIYSPQTTVQVNTTNAVKAYNRAMAGGDIFKGEVIGSIKRETIGTYSDMKAAQSAARAAGGRAAGVQARQVGDKVIVEKGPLEADAIFKGAGGKNAGVIRQNVGDEIRIYKPDPSYDNIATAQRDLAAQLLMKEGVQFDGRKINNFYINLMRQIDPDLVQGVTSDLWMARAFGFLDDNVGKTKKYDLIESMTNDVANELGWEPHQAQAAIWTAIKARMESPEVKANVRQKAIDQGVARMSGKTLEVLDDDAYSSLKIDEAMGQSFSEEQIGKAVKDFSYFLEENYARMPWEAIPGRSTGHMGGLSDAPYQIRNEYTSDIAQAMQNDQGNDAIAEALGILSPGHFEAPGYWQGDINPSRVEKIASTRIKGAGKAPDIQAEDEQLIRIYAAARGLALRQEGVGYYRPFVINEQSKANGISIKPIGNKFTSEDAVAIGSRLDEAMQSPLTDAKGNVLVDNAGNPIKLEGFLTGYDEGELSFIHFNQFADVGNPADPKATARAKGNVVKAANDRIKQIIQGSIDKDVDLEYFASSGDLLMNDWKGNPNGQDYVRILQEAGRSDVLDIVQNVLAPKIRRVDEEYAAKHGFRIGPDIFGETGGANAGAAQNIPSGLLGNVPPPTTNGLLD